MNPKHISAFLADLSAVLESYPDIATPEVTRDVTARFLQSASTALTSGPKKQNRKPEVTSVAA